MWYLKRGLQLNNTFLFDSHTLIGEKFLTSLCWLLLQFDLLLLKNQTNCETSYTNMHIHFYIFGGEKKRQKPVYQKSKYT